MANLLADILQGVAVSNADTGRESIEYIPIGKLVPDPENFYSLDGLDQLAGNIELCGLQQPLRVRPTGDGTYMVISGHRRLAAINLINDGGSEQFRDGVPCIKEVPSNSPAMQELKLIFANRDTRAMTSADIQKQAKRVEELLYQLKEEGVDFPGRMRDYVAEACQVSKTKLARLKAIDNRLHSAARPAYESGELSESTAYALSQLPEDEQELILGARDNMRYLYENTVERMSEDIRKLKERSCAKTGGACENLQACLSRQYTNGYRGFDCNDCCLKCDRLAGCTKSCVHAAEKKEKLKVKKKEETEAAKKAAEEKEAPIRDLYRKVWTAELKARQKANLDVEDVLDACDLYSGPDTVSKFMKAEDGEVKYSCSASLPYGWRISLDTIKLLDTIRKAYGLTLEEILFGEAPATVSDSDTPAWIAGKPQKSGMYYAVLDCGGETMTSLVYYDATVDSWRFSKAGHPVGAEVTRWHALPEN